jgi:thiol-disulfide isomerase/thioredoxin
MNIKRAFFFLVIFTLSTTLSIAQTNLPGKLKEFEGSGKPLVVTFWATWCSPCIEELEALSEHYKENSKSLSFDFVAVSIDDTRSSAKVKSFIAGKGWPFIVLTDDNQEIMKSLNITQIPSCIIFNKNGVVKFRHSGYVPGDELIIYKELKKFCNE